MAKTAAETLKQAAELIRQDGWTRGYYQRAGRYCAAGAIRAAVRSDEAESRAAMSLLAERVLASEDDGPGHVIWAWTPETRVIQWNDRQKDRRVVIRMLEEAGA